MPKVCVIAVNVHDMDAALEFYTKKLGMKVEDRQHYPEIVQLEHDGLPFLLQKVARPRKVDYPNEAQSLINFEVPHLSKAMKDLKRKGVELIHTTAQPCPVGVFAAFRDPSGNVHELLEFQEPPT